MEAQVKVVAENPVTGEYVHTNTAYLVYVALGDDGRAIEVPSLIVESDSERARMQGGRSRQQYRLSQRHLADDS
jgi:acyl-CoA hydrolase